MATKLSVGLQKKVGLPNYGSLGASCQLEFEIDRTLLEGQHDQFQQRVRQAFASCQQAIEEQLHRQQSGQPTTNGYVNGSPRPATASQVRAIRAIAYRRQVDLQGLLRRRFHVDRPDDLSITTASQLIDELKQPAEHNGSRR